MHPLMDWILPYEGLAVSVEGKDALFFKARSASSYRLDTAFMRVRQFPLRGRMHSLRAGVHPFHGLNALFGG